MREVRERGTARRKRSARSVREARAERFEQSCAAVVRGAAADPDDDPARSAGDRLGDQFSGPKRRRTARVAVACVEQMQPRGIRHLDDRGLTVDRKNGLDRHTERSANHFRLRRCAQIHERRERPFAAIGHRDPHDLAGAEYRAQPGFDLERDGAGIEAILEFVGGDDDAQRRYFVAARCNGILSVSVCPTVTDSPLI